MDPTPYESRDRSEITKAHGNIQLAEATLQKARSKNHEAARALHKAEARYYLTPHRSAEALDAIERARKELGESRSEYRLAADGLSRARELLEAAVEEYRTAYGRDPQMGLGSPSVRDTGTTRKLEVSCIRIESVQHFMRVVDQIESRYGPEYRDPEISKWNFYRGHGDEMYSLEPSLYRSTDAVPILFADEQLLIAETLRLMPSEFAGLSAFQTLAKLQHYGLPTRLLDVTTNPLVALFFACYGSPYRDGEVVVLPRKPVYTEASERVRWISNWATTGRWGVVPEEHIVESTGYGDATNLSLRGDCPSLFEALTTRFTAVRPQYSNERLRAQSGAFLIAGMEIVQSPTTKGEFLVMPHRGSVDGSSHADTTGVVHEPRIIVERRVKARILRQLDRIDVNVATMFPDPENTIRYIKDGFASRTFGMTRHSDPSLLD